MKIEKIKKTTELFQDKLIRTLCFCNIFVWLVAWQRQYGNIEDMPTFFITLIAFLAAAIAIWQQYKAFEDQKEANIKQEIIGAWQVLANRAAGNSGKKEAIEFLAKQKLSLNGINMSEEHNDGEVYLGGLDVSEKTLGHKADLWNAHFEGAYLIGAHFEGANLFRANFKDAALWNARFEGANLKEAHFKDATLWNARFEGAYIITISKNEDPKEFLPTTGKKNQYKFEFDMDKESEPQLDKEGNKTARTKHFIKLVPNPNYKPKAKPKPKSKPKAK